MAWKSSKYASPPTVQMPQPGVPQIMTLEGRYVRIAYNNEGYVSLGYRAANDSVGDPWILLEVGMTIRDGVKNFDLPRANVSLTTPDDRIAEAVERIERSLRL